MNRPSDPGRPRKAAFTLIEMLVVILILGILVALLVPAISGAVRTAQNARVTGDITVFGQALASFKNKFGEAPPSRIVLNENGAYNTISPAPLNTIAFYSLPAQASGYPAIGGISNPSGSPLYTPGRDVNFGTLSQRSLGYLRKFFPRATLIAGTTNPLLTAGSPVTAYHDINDSGSLDGAPYYLEGHECLVFFLGGLASFSANTVGMTGFSANPNNPFIHDHVPGGANRTQKYFEFSGDRLYDDDGDFVPGYIDSLGTLTDGRYFAYFSSYGSAGYDPNDVTFALADDALARPFRVSFTVPNGGAPTNEIVSPVPNPYTNGPGVPTGTRLAAFQNSESYQIISPGADRQYGMGGPYLPSSTAERLPVDLTPPPADQSIRVRERDNLTNFAQSKLD
jgi:prepilin-type N-terminal cleavage/methylation domain-containing protein